MSTLDYFNMLRYEGNQSMVNLSEKQLAEELNDEFIDAILPVTVFVGLEILLGILGNSVVLYVFLFHYHVCNFRYFVLCLALTDILSCLTTMPGEIVTQLKWYVYPMREVCKIKSFFNVFTVSAEALCLLTIAFDRYRKVCQPFSWQMKPRIALYTCYVIYIVAFILAVPVSILWGLHSHQKFFRNIVINVTICEKDEQFKDTIYPLIYSLSMESIISVCLLMMLSFYILVARKLVTEKRKQNKSGAHLVVMTRAKETSDTQKTIETKAEVSHAEFSSGHFTKTQRAWEVKTDDHTSDNESDPKETGTTLAVSGVTRGKQPSTKKVRTQIVSGNRGRPRNRLDISARVRRKTLIMFILTVTFIATTILYLTLLSFIARSDNVLQDMSHNGKAAYFFFFRLYFLNHVINPIVYGLLDTRFKKLMKSFSEKRQ